jgi:hypothetical protein
MKGRSLGGVETRHGANQDPEVLETIAELAGQGISAVQIHRSITKLFGARAPQAEKTTQLIVRQLRRTDASRPWTVIDGDPTEIQVVLRVIAHLLRHDLHGGRTGVTRKEGVAIARVATAAPDLTDHWLWEVAMKYAQRESLSWPTAGLDHMLACAPWRSDDAFASYVSIYRDRLGASVLPQIVDNRIHYPEGALRTAVLMTAERRSLSETEVLLASRLLNVKGAGQ